MLTERYPLETLKKSLLPRERWRPYPTASDRAPYEALPASVRQAYLARGEEALRFPWPILPATLFLDYARTGNRTRFQDARNARRDALRDLVLAECVEGKARFVDQIANGLWATCEETYWGVPAHLRLQKAGPGLPDVSEPTVDLFAAETSALLAWTCYLLTPHLDAVSPLIRPRLHREIDRRILAPLLEREDFSWMGFLKGARRVNNWNPWINSNWLISFLVMEQDEERRLSGVAKSLRCLDNFLDPYPRDGGCDEGPGYWGRAAASLFECLELLESATHGAVRLYDDPLVRNMGGFIYRVHIHNDYFVNFADASPVVTPSPSLVFRYGRRVGDDRLSAFGAWAAAHQGIAQRGFSDSLARQLAGLFSLPDLLSAKGSQPLPGDAYFPEIQVMTARSKEGSPEGLFVAAKGGHNNESHNHNDVGNCVVYADGRPVLIDTGVEPYTAQNSGPRRYEIWTMQSAYHNLPTVNGVMQQAGAERAAKEVAYAADKATARFSLDLADAYPPEAHLASWVRTLTLSRGRDLLVTEAYRLSQPAKEITLSLMTPCEVVQEGPGALLLKETPLVDGRASGAARIHYDAARLKVSTETISLEAGERLKNVWGKRLLRITLRAENPPLQDTWTLRIESV
ncbi:MAG: hypothetical protein A3F84_18055 [Candidatus Handelsmanbacteria bacterium RIFCSPLOWO2_12_FULL_64_10]|uniref:Heparinase II/III-like C-terminal domain-containing protein n=1 Tax=Handelsmanbacteria sp. (strain RIFCSPLOWO2_12_FULL_64_10) TaxID=1817868 RepID=A0A1F6CM15_HANXR|nr:MAG: hypothetical protein A3F84_18055 [Candidatus Handelsmanbacteria bacterium RIFCSPLOWO2_12_FULL_64_10]